MQTVIATIAFLIAVLCSGCATMDGTETIRVFTDPAGDTGLGPDRMLYKPTPAEAWTYVAQCVDNKPFGDCDDNANRAVQNCRDLYNNRAKSVSRIGLACWVAEGWLNGSYHDLIAFLTTDGWRFYDQNSTSDVTSTFKFKRIIK